MSDVEYVYLFFKVNKCSDLVAYGRGRTAARLVLQSVNLLPVGRSPSRGCGSLLQPAKLLSVDRSPSRGCAPVSVGTRPLLPRWMMIETKLKAQDCLFYNLCLSFGTEARNFLQRFSVGHRDDSPCYRRCWKFSTASLAVFAWIKTSMQFKSLAIFFWFKLSRRLKFPRGNFRCGSVVSLETVPTMLCVISVTS